MRPINFEGANIIFTAPKGWDSERDGACIDLPVQKTPDGECVSFWKPTAAERQAIAHGAPIRLGVFGGQPPVMLSVAPVAELPPRSAERDRPSPDASGDGGQGK